MDYQIVNEKLLFIRKKWQFIGENFYLLALIIYILSQFLPGTMFPSLLPSDLLYRTTQVSGFLVILKMGLFDFEIKDGKWKNWLIYILLGLILWKSCADAYQYNLYYYYLFVLGAQNIDYKKLLKVFLITMSLLVVVTIIAAKLHIIPGLTMGRFGTPTIRYALGMIYPSDLAARAFYLMLAYCVFKRFSFNVAEYVGCFAWTLFIYFITDTKLDLILMLLVILAVMIYPYLITVFEFLGAKIVVAGTLFVTGVSVLMAYFYNSANPIFNLLDRILSGRLKYGHAAFEKYNVTVYGQFIRQNGNGGIHSPILDYFFIDSSYVKHLMMNGLIAFTVIMVIICVLILRNMQVKAYSLVLYTLFMVISSIIDQHMLEISFNFIFIALLADTSYFVNNLPRKSKLNGEEIK